MDSFESFTLLHHDIFQKHLMRGATICSLILEEHKTKDIKI